VGRVLQDVNSLPQEKLQEKKSLVVKPKIKSGWADDFSYQVFKLNIIVL